MNVLFFLKPKYSVAYLLEEDTLRQALEKMEHYHYSAVPVLTKDGKYAYTLSEGDILWHIKSLGHYDSFDAENIPISSIKRYREIRYFYSYQSIESLIELTVNQNFVPILDDRDMFIGIVTRQDIIRYYYQKLGMDGIKYDE